MLIIGTFSLDIKEAIEDQLAEYKDKFKLKLLDKNKGILNTDKSELKDMNTLFTKRLSIEEFKVLPKLKTILVPMTGLDRIDESIVANPDIQILNAHSTAPYIAERGMGILMTLAGKIDKQSNDLKQNIWNDVGEQGKWFSLRDKRIGIYGYGHIGKAFEQMIRPFSSKIYTIDRGKDYPDNVHLVNNLQSLTKVSDVLFIAVPGNSQTKDTIGKEELNNLKDGLIVNVGRGLVVNEKALNKALKNGVIKGYGSDVWYNYPKINDISCQPSDQYLGDFDHIVMTPHNAWNHDKREGLIINEMMQHLKSLLL